MEVKFFITVLNGVITGKHGGNIDEDFFGTEYYAHEKIEIPNEAEIRPFDLLTYYDKAWKRKSNAQLIKEKILPMPKGYKWQGDELCGMSKDERIIEGLEPPEQGFKLEKGKVVEMTMKEKVTAGLITQEQFNEQLSDYNNNELQNRLIALQTPEAMAQSEIDEEYAMERIKKLKALLAVKEQKNWPLEVVWP